MDIIQKTINIKDLNKTLLSNKGKSNVSIAKEYVNHYTTRNNVSIWHV